ncbi:hypothetical protein [Powai lake megavirus]|uniref:Uncharacterized protein n=1 Tax=Powai lake megavirus TaxID=1842663 RepID=A0A167RB31_9VIRU|nr:hypothetical protein QJ849_gp328 [Powai lake megavirus]ANB50490.1 hypothetical protein [Powai lake megavirus]
MSDDNYSNISHICKSIRTKYEPHLRCVLKAKPGNNYCAIHMSQKHIINFNESMDQHLSYIDKYYPEIKESHNNIISVMNLDDLLGLKVKSPEINNIKPNIIKKKMHNKEQKAQVVENIYNDNQDDLEIKLLVLINDEEYSEKIKKLIGPIYDDITMSEDEYDPITYDAIWTIKNHNKIPGDINKYYLFSYLDSNDKIRCFTIFSIKDMLENEQVEYKHPITQELIPEIDIQRARDLINIYRTKIGLFNDNYNTHYSDEYKLKCRISKLFKKFHVHSIFMEEKWLLSIDNQTKLDKIISETKKLIDSNIKIINPNLKKNTIFIKPKNKNSNNSGETILSKQEYIVGQWEKLIDSADTPNNQIPIWIIISGLSFAVPEIKKKFPDIDIIIG